MTSCVEGIELRYISVLRLLATVPMVFRASISVLIGMAMPVLCAGPGALAQASQELDRPNILWLVAEDMSPYIAAYGDDTAPTPVLDRLAAEGVRYENVYSVSGVCAPSRAALITGMYPTSIGAHHMRTTFQQPEAIERGLINYEVVPPPEVRMVSELLRKHGYYTVNNSKEDYQFHPSLMAWDESSLFAHWRNRPEGAPFFAVFNFGVTHEGQLWAPAPEWNLRYGREVFPPDRNEPLEWHRFEEGEEKQLYVSGNIEFEVPPYLPNTSVVRRDMLRMYSNIAEMDSYVGVVLRQLDEDGLLENTIVMWFSDHGGPLPRQKRTLYDSGLRVPLIIRYPDLRRAGEVDDTLVSFVDFAPTLLSMLGIEPPNHMQGRPFAGRHANAGEPHEYIFAAADRFDGYYDMIRAVRDQRFKYLRSFMPDSGYYLPLAYREQMASMRELLRLRDAGELDKVQSQWFRAHKPVEELFDTQSDPHELHNLAGNPIHAQRLEKMRAALDQWMSETGDLGFVDEQELIEGFWPNREQPKTQAPEARLEGGRVVLTSDTHGASVGYRLLGEEMPGRGWRVYSEPLELAKGVTIEAIAHRLGFLPSDGVTYTRP